MFMSNDTCIVITQDEVERERYEVHRFPREGDELQLAEDDENSVEGQKHCLLHTVREIWQIVIFTSLEEIEYISPTMPYYEVRGSHVATVLLLAHYRAQICVRYYNGRGHRPSNSGRPCATTSYKAEDKKA
ncbi:hypothetical protein GGI35DRAFT_464036 [Trichoderma velutinum]